MGCLSYSVVSDVKNFLKPLFKDLKKVRPLLQVVASRVFNVQSFKNMCFREEEHPILLAPSKPKSDYHRKNCGNVKITN